MGLPEPQRQSVEMLCKRFSLHRKILFELVLDGQLTLWAQLRDVDTQDKTDFEAGHFHKGKQHHNVLEVAMSHAIIEDMVAKGAIWSRYELKYGGECFNINGRDIMVRQRGLYNIEINPSQMFSRLEDVKSFEAVHDINIHQDNGPAPPAQLLAKREGTLLKVIGALLTMKYQDQSYFKGNGEVNADHMARQFNIDLAGAGFTDDGLKSDTIRKTVLKQAFEAIAENRRE